MHILIAEDEAALCYALKQILEKEGFFTDAVLNGTDALHYALNFSYDLIILDVMLPHFNGFDVVCELRKRNLSTPILILSARSAVCDKVMGLNCGADDYLTKPFDTDELIARVNALTRRVGVIALNELSFSDLTLNLKSAELFCGDMSVQLSKKEFEVARIFLSSPHTTITKESIIIKVWGIESEATDNNAEAYISFLRKKLKFLNSAVSIKNIQKIGYRLEVAPC